MSILGNRVLRIEDPRLLTEGGRYVADLRDRRLDGAVHATYVRATVAHATIAGRRRQRRPGLPGVVAVVTAADVDLAPDARYGQPPRWPARPGRRPGPVRRRAGGRRAHRAARAGRRRRRVGGRRLRAAARGRRPDGGARRARCVLFPEAGTNMVGAFGTSPAPTAPTGSTAARSWSASGSSTSAWPPARSRCGRRRRPGSTGGW